MKPPFPFTPGHEIAGIVDAAGEGVSGIVSIDRVLSMPMGRAFAEYSIASAGRVFEFPRGDGFSRSGCDACCLSHFVLRAREARRN